MATPNKARKIKTASARSRSDELNYDPAPMDLAEGESPMGEIEDLTNQLDYALITLSLSVEAMEKRLQLVLTHRVDATDKTDPELRRSYDSRLAISLDALLARVQHVNDHVRRITDDVRL
ncbi:hypothetical protein [Achromobacter phage Motura]|uniref:Uncharacterized protein n=1 Tax=Achromobacter phage Motura TaxID=2591403 RepID=A0A514CT60_9CAUD|nr:hypothetical protein H1O15_gp081 [Achromobacter phage Motura]QDH83669.1 hypothetical protein [Achromobacter phage Motura]